MFSTGQEERWLWYQYVRSWKNLEEEIEKEIEREEERKQVYIFIHKEILVTICTYRLSQHRNN